MTRYWLVLPKLSIQELLWFSLALIGAIFLKKLFVEAQSEQCRQKANIYEMFFCFVFPITFIILKQINVCHHFHLEYFIWLQALGYIYIYMGRMWSVWPWQPPLPPLLPQPLEQTSHSCLSMRALHTPQYLISWKSTLAESIRAHEYLWITSVKVSTSPLLLRRTAKLITLSG